PAGTEAIASLISGLPYGVISYDRHFEGLPETSLNLGILRLSEDSLEYHHYLRSSSSADIEGLFRTLEDGITRRGGQIRSFGGYPEWRYREDSPLRDILLGAYRDVSGKEASIKGTHGGLECGVFCSNIPDADIVSANPDLRDVHSVNEHLDVETSKRLYDVLRLTLKRISEAGTGR
ncbi:MAG: M20/M25/M40 family metallo-hydrolase, partial [Spirochaetales bacterium]|nr:M20/M25/M40 family metallo-hydrolase [Spirochaetales bacterium]